MRLTMSQNVSEDMGDSDSLESQKFFIAETTRYLEIVGYSISLVAILLSLFIFHIHRSLHNQRTLIHRNLLGGMLLEIVIRLILYIDQAIVRYYGEENIDNMILFGIRSLPYLCECFYVLMEYSVTVIFTWMFIEGVVLNNMVTTRALRKQFSSFIFCMVGWILPIGLTAVWAVITANYYAKENIKTCWYGYNFHWFYWIIQGPRWGVVLVNGTFLVSILRSLMVKMQQTRNSEVQKMKKAVHAAIILLPLLGGTNSLNMIEAPLDGSVLRFAIWCYVTHFFRSFQGLFIAMIHCFLNAEVQAAVKKHYVNYKIMREYRRRRPGSFTYGLTGPRLNETGNEGTENIPMSTLRWNRDTSTSNNVAVSEGNPGTSNVDRIEPRQTAVAVRFADPPMTEEYPAPTDYIPPRTVRPPRRMLTAFVGVQGQSDIGGPSAENTTPV